MFEYIRVLGFPSTSSRSYQMEWWKLLLSVVRLDRNLDVNGHGESIKAVPLVSDRTAEVEHPPDDDCCPICFDKYLAACRAPCGHWYCGACILRYWNYGAALKPCKCPLCSQNITCLMPEPTIDRSQYSEVLTSVQDYNNLFVGGINGLIMKVRKSPLLLKWFFQEMMNPDAADNNLLKARLLATLLGALYTLSPLDFLPGRLRAIDLLDNIAMAVVFILYLFGLFRRRQQHRRVRQLTLAPPQDNDNGNENENDSEPQASRF